MPVISRATPHETFPQPAPPPPPEPAPAAPPPPLENDGDLLAQVRSLHTETMHALGEARADGDFRGLLMAIRAARANLELVARLLGRVEDGPTTDVLEHPDWLAVREAMIEALEPYPEARRAVADRLLTLQCPSGPAEP